MGSKGKERKTRYFVLDVMLPLQPKQQAVPLASVPPSRNSSLVQAAWCVRMHPCWLERDGEQNAADLAVCCWIDLEGAEEGGSAAGQKLPGSSAVVFCRQPSCSTPALPSMSSSHCLRGGGSIWAMGMGKHGLSASQAELRPVLNKPRTEPKLRR